MHGLLRELQSLSYDSKKAEEWLIQGIRQIQYKDVKHAIENNLFADDLLFAHFKKYMANPLLSPVIKYIFRKQWLIISPLLCDVREIRKIMIENRSEFEELLSDSKGISWLNTCAKRGYQRIYDYTWG